MLTGPVPHQHIYTVVWCTARYFYEAVGHLLTIEQIENLVGGGSLFPSVRSVIDFLRLISKAAPGLSPEGGKENHTLLHRSDRGVGDYRNKKL